MTPHSEDEVAFEQALATLKRTPAEVRQRRRNKIVNQIADLERELQLLDSLPSDNGTSSSSASPETIESSDNGDEVKQPPTKPQGLLLVLSEHPTRARKLSEVRDIMVERGWLQPGEKGTHQIQNTAWKLKNRGDVRSPRNAYYRITQQGLEAVGRG